MFLICGLTISWIDIYMFGSGLYLALVSIVTVVIVLAFCVVGTDEQTEPTVAKQMWSKSRQTLRRYTIRQPRQHGPKIVTSSDDLETGLQHKFIIEKPHQVHFQTPDMIEIQEPAESISKTTTIDANDTHITETDGRILCQSPSTLSTFKCLEFDNSTVVYL